MYHSTSGKKGFRAYQQPWEPPFLVIPKTQMKLILQREEELRASLEIQNQYTESDDLAHLRDVTIELQKRALRENGIKEEHLQQALNILHSARFTYQHDPEMNNITIYQRKDRSREGNVQMGLPIFDDIVVYNLEGKPVVLKRYIDELLSQNPLPVLIFSGSVS